MSREKIKFDHSLAIIINNTCNLTCNNCGTAQCYNFDGVYNWIDTAEYYKKWSEIIDVPAIDILGGEPYLNPDLFEWAKNIKNLWPDSDINVETNGTLLFLDKNISITRQLFDIQVGILVSTHKKDEFQLHESYIKKILEPYMHDVKIVIIEEDQEVEYIFKGKPLVRHTLIDMMHQNYIREIKDGVLYLSEGDPVKNHENCFSSTDCFTMQQGLLYKCPLVVNYAEAKKQIAYEKKAKDLLDQYRPCSPYDELTDIQTHIDNLVNMIPQCALCPYDKVPNSKVNVYPVTFDKSWKHMFKTV
jgi:organic radical activating enzyme